MLDDPWRTAGEQDEGRQSLTATKCVEENLVEGTVSETTRAEDDRYVLGKQENKHQ